MDRRRRRRYGDSKRPVSRGSLTAAGVAGASIVVYIIFLLVAVSNSGNTTNAVSGIAVLAMIAAFATLGYGTRRYKDDSNSVSSRVVGVAVPAVASAMWVILYVIGMVRG